MGLKDLIGDSIHVFEERYDDFEQNTIDDIILVSNRPQQVLQRSIAQLGGREGEMQKKEQLAI